MLGNCLIKIKIRIGFKFSSCDPTLGLVMDVNVNKIAIS